MIDILIPVLGRPQNAKPLVESIHAATTVGHTCIFLATPGDTEQIEACKRTNAVTHLVAGDDFQYARKINAGAVFDYRNTPHEFMLLAADDLRFKPGWDVAAIRVWEETGKPVIGTNDLGNATVMKGLHATHSLVHRSYLEQGTIDEVGKLLHEGYHHNFCDTEFIDTAKHRDAFVFAADSHVEHLHPFWRKGPDDMIYRRGRKTFPRDRQTYLKRRSLWR